LVNFLRIHQKKGIKKTENLHPYCVIPCPFTRKFRSYVSAFNII